jgi:hypothetical protein
MYGARAGRARWAAAGTLLVLVALIGASASAAEPVCVRIVDDLARVRGDDHVPCPGPPAPLTLTALRDEVVAFQVILQAGDAPLANARVDLELAAPGVTVERFVEHYVLVAERSRGKDAGESLGWFPAARPEDAAILGQVPDALVPVDHAPAWRPYPMAAAAGKNAAVWIDIGVAADAAPGRHEGWLIVSADGGLAMRVPIALEIGGPVLPYRAVSLFAAYDNDALTGRLEDPAGAERQLWQLLHAHGLDALVDLRRPEDVGKVAGALDGTWFDAAAGYHGPGVGVVPAVVALGAYGALGDPEPGKRPLVVALAAAIPEAIQDVFLYAEDEDCKSPRGPGWRKLLAEGPALPRPVLVAHSCSEPPAGQDVDLVLQVAEAFNVRDASAARDHGRRVWVYNGRLPRAPTLLLDAPASAAAAFGWIAATHDVDRWFLWMTDFWNDDNRGGKGPIDPFTTVASFHNKDGDVALLDGLYVYPGTQKGPFATHSVGVPGVLPSMRLKRLRRGLEDAGYLALAAASDPGAATRISEAALPRALDEVTEGEHRVWPDDGIGFAVAREQLRALIPEDASLDEKAARAALHQVAERRLVPVHAASAGLRHAADADEDGRWRPWIIAAFVLFAVAVIAAFVVVVRRVSRS